MEYINLKYKGNHARRSQPFGMGGFMLEAPVKFEDGREIIRRGQLGLQFKLLIPPDGTCRVPDTEHNRAILRVHCSPRTETVHGDKIKFPETYELISKINLKDDAPDKPEKTYTQAELEAILAKKTLELQKAKPLTEAEKKKAEEDLKVKEQAAADEVKRIADEDEAEKKRLDDLANETDAQRDERVKAERFANKVG